MRKLLQNSDEFEGSDEESEDMARDVAIARRAHQLGFSHREQAVRNQAVRVIAAHLSTRSAKWAWQRHILYVVQRARDLEAMACAMLNASQLGFSIDEVQSAFALIDPASKPASEPLPDYLREWHAPPHVSLTRYQNHGITEWLPSEVFASVFAVSAPMHSGLISLLEKQGDREHIVEITGRLWAQISADEALTQYVQVEGDRAVSFTIKGQTHGPYKLRGRLVVHDKSLATWTCINLVPAPKPEPKPPAAGTGSGFVFAPPGGSAAAAAAMVALLGAAPTPHASAGDEGLRELLASVVPQPHATLPEHGLTGDAADAAASDGTMFDASELDALFGHSELGAHSSEQAAEIDLERLPLDDLLALVNEGGVA